MIKKRRKQLIFFVTILLINVAFSLKLLLFFNIASYIFVILMKMSYGSSTHITLLYCKYKRSPKSKILFFFSPSIQIPSIFKLLLWNFKIHNICENYLKSLFNLHILYFILKFISTDVFVMLQIYFDLNWSIFIQPAFLDTIKKT